MMYGWHEGGWGILWMILSWAAIVGVVVLIVRAFTREPPSTSPRQRDPLEILDERYARGEISEAEYRDRRQVLHEARR
jgi:putative membrane protein